MALTGNLLLDGLTCPDLKSSILQLARPVAFMAGKPFAEEGVVPNDLYFLTSGVASSRLRLQDGSSCEVEMVGREGLIGFRALLGPNPSVGSHVMQTDGNALKVPLSCLRRVFSDSEEFRQQVLHLDFCQAQILAQLTACGLKHETGKRIARWLLMMCDRLHSDFVRVTQEDLGERLSVMRSTVSVVTGNLEKAGMIHTRRGTITILDRPALAAHCCECYAICRAFADAIYPEPC